MNEYLNTYCPECDVEVYAALRTQPTVLPVRGEDISFDETVAICPECGCEIGDSSIEERNLNLAYAIYRNSHGILSPADIRNLRVAYDMSLREFSKFLGFGEQTIYRYERGDIPDPAHNSVIMSARTPEGAQMLLAQNGKKLSSKSVEKVKRQIEFMRSGTFIEHDTDYHLIKLEAESPSAANGYRALSIDRVASLVHFLANNCNKLYWTTLQKALFCIDMTCYERNGYSLTGLSYAHAPFGPVMNRKDDVRAALTGRGTVAFVEESNGPGEILQSLDDEPLLFSPDELALIEEVASFVNSFPNAKGLSEFSHGFSSWKDTPNGHVIEYPSSNGEVSKAIAARMEKSS